MNRRKFFSDLGAAVLGTYLACKVKPLKLLLEQAPVVKEFVLNPEWVSAPYEVSFLCSVYRNQVVPIVHNRVIEQTELPTTKTEYVKYKEVFPLRLDKDGKIIQPTLPS